MKTHTVLLPCNKNTSLKLLPSNNCEKCGQWDQEYKKCEFEIINGKIPKISVQVIPNKKYGEFFGYELIKLFSR